MPVTEALWALKELLTARVAEADAGQAVTATAEDIERRARARQGRG